MVFLEVLALRSLYGQDFALYKYLNYYYLNIRNNYFNYYYLNTVLFNHYYPNIRNSTDTLLNFCVWAMNTAPCQTQSIDLECVKRALPPPPTHTPHPPPDPTIHDGYIRKLYKTDAVEKLLKKKKKKKRHFT